MSLAEIQRKLRVAKDKKNEFGGYSYRTAEGILAAAKPYLPDDASIVLSDDVIEVAGSIFLVATATLKFGDGAAEAASSPALHALTKKGMDAAQISGSTSSYARKYALQGLFAIDDSSVDPDGRDNREPDEPEFQPAAARDRIKAAILKAATVEQLAEIWKGEWPTIQQLPQPMQGELTKTKDDQKAKVHSDSAGQAPNTGNVYG